MKALEFYLLGALEGRAKASGESDTTGLEEATAEGDQPPAAGLIGGSGYQVSTLPEEVEW